MELGFKIVLFFFHYKLAAAAAIFLENIYLAKLKFDMPAKNKQKTIYFETGHK